MDNFRLEDEQPTVLRPVQEKPFFIRLVLRTGIVSTDQQAQYVLLGIVAAVLAVSAYLAIPRVPQATIPHQPGDELRGIPRPTP